MVVFKILMFIWPFIKEMLFDGKSAKVIIAGNKKRSLIAIFIFISVAINALVVPRLYSVSRDYLALVKTTKALSECSVAKQTLTNIPDNPVDPLQNKTPKKKEAVLTVKVNTTVRKEILKDKSKEIPHPKDVLDVSKKDFNDILKKEETILKDRDWDMNN